MPGKLLYPPSALCPMLSALCPMLYALCSMPLLWGELDAKAIDLLIDADLAAEATII